MKKILILFALAFSTVEGVAQQSQDVALYNSLGTNLLTDTVTNTGTAVISTRRLPGHRNTTTITIVCTEISGTTGGTITIQGSIDGTNYKAIPTVDTQTSITTATALDVASQVFTWRLNGSPYLYYRVSWAGTGTMSATVAGRLMSH